MNDIKTMLKSGKKESEIMKEYQYDLMKQINDIKREIAAEEKAEKEKKAKQEKQNKVRGELKEALCHYLAAKGNPSPSKVADMWIKEIDRMEDTANALMKYFM